MERTNLPFFYTLGAKLNPLSEMNLSSKSRIDILVIAMNAKPWVEQLLGSFSVLTVCRNDGLQLVNAIDEWAKAWSTQEANEPPDSTDYFKCRTMVDKARAFEAVLAAELQTLATYHVTQKGAYSTSDLVEHAENVFPPSVRARISEEALEEVRESGRCLAYDNATACGFHIIRATELVMHNYYVAVCKPKPKPKAKQLLSSWGEYLSKFSALPDADVKKVVAILQQIKDQDRNLIMHPELVLSPDDAFTLFEVAQGAIIAMASRLPQRKQKKVPAKSAHAQVKE